MWITKIIGILTQLCIIILAVLLVYQFSSKQIYEGRVDSIERTLNAKIDENKKYLNDKITIQQDNVNRYIQLREDRAKLYSSRIDELYSLYKKNPDPIDKAHGSAAQIVAETTTPPPSVIDSNFSYFETKINRIDEKLDNLDNKISSKITVLEQRLDVLQTDKKNNTKVITNNINTVGNITTR